MKWGTALSVFVIIATSIQVFAAEDCSRLQQATSDALVSYLTEVVPGETSGDCVTTAIRRLDGFRYEPAIPVLIKLLDFRRPRTELEKEGIAVRMQQIDEIYPAASGLERIGKGALPAVLETIKSPATSAIARKNAVSVWMVIHKYEHVEAVSVLKREALASADPAANQNLRWAVSEASRHCNPREVAGCRAAALMPTD